MGQDRRTRWLRTALRWATVALILKVTASIVANYVDYFPPDFNSLFLEGREATFRGLYPVAFYTHILAGPLILLSGLALTLERIRSRYGAFHRGLGRAHVLGTLGLLVPSSLIMSAYAFSGWPAGLSFALLTLATGSCAAMGIARARQRRFADHRRWMNRCLVLLCSAIGLRMISGALSASGVEEPETAYVIAAWASWVVPLAAFEMLAHRRGTQAATVAGAG